MTGSSINYRNYRPRRRSSVVDFFQDRNAPLNHPLVETNTRKYSHYKLSADEIIRCVQSLKPTSKKINQMEILSIDFYVIPKVVVKHIKQSRFLTKTTPLDIKQEKLWSLQDSNPTRNGNFIKYLPEKLYVRCKRCNRKHGDDETDYVCVQCQGSQMTMCHQCGGNGYRTSFISGNFSGTSGACYSCYGIGKILCGACTGHSSACNHCQNGFHKTMIVKSESVRSVELVTPFMDEKTTEWVKKLRQIPQDKHASFDNCGYSDCESLQQLSQIKLGMHRNIEAQLHGHSKIVGNKCHLEMIPVHLVEYTYPSGQTAKNKCPGKFLIGGFCPKIKWLLKFEEVHSIEKSYRRRSQSTSQRASQFLERKISRPFRQRFASLQITTKEATPTKVSRVSKSLPKMTK